MDNENKKGKRLVRITIVVTTLLTLIFWYLRYFVIDELF